MSISRREFIQASGKTLLGLCCIPMLNGCSGVKRADFSWEIPGIQGLSADRAEILRLASLAPSGHNTQPWGVKIIDQNHWIIMSDARRWLPAVDPQQRETMLSIGAFLENLVIAARSFGYDPVITTVAKSTFAEEIAEVRLTKLSRSGDQVLPEEIRRRRTVRKGYRAQELTLGDVQYLFGKDAEQSHYIPLGSGAGRYLTEGTIESNRQQANREVAQKELAHWIRWSDDDAKKMRDGLTPEGMEIRGLAGWYVRTFYTREDVSTKGFCETTVKAVIEQARTCGGWVVLTTRDSSVSSLLEAGQRFQRLFLRARQRMIAIHPMTQMLEEEPWRSAVGSEIGVREQLQFILRVGYLDKYPDPVSLRRPVQAFLRS